MRGSSSSHSLLERGRKEVDEVWAWGDSEASNAPPPCAQGIMRREFLDGLRVIIIIYDNNSLPYMVVSLFMYREFKEIFYAETQNLLNLLDQIQAAL